MISNRTFKFINGFTRSPSKLKISPFRMEPLISDFLVLATKKENFQTLKISIKNTELREAIKALNSDEIKFFLPEIISHTRNGNEFHVKECVNLINDRYALESLLPFFSGTSFKQQRVTNMLKDRIQQIAEEQRLPTTALTTHNNLKKRKAEDAFDTTPHKKVSNNLAITWLSQPQETYLDILEDLACWSPVRQCENTDENELQANNNNSTQTLAAQTSNSTSSFFNQSIKKPNQNDALFRQELNEIFQQEEIKAFWPDNDPEELENQMILGKFTR